MAPDIDADVAVAKLFKALSDPDMPYGPAPNPRMVIERPPGFHITIYVSPDDKALAASSWMFGSLARLGRLDTAMLTPEQIEQARTVGIIDVIQVRGTTDLFGHSYFTSNPRASADLIAMLRYGLRPNEPGRPLEEIERPFWRLPTEAGAGGAEIDGVRYIARIEPEGAARATARIAGDGARSACRTAGGDRRLGRAPARVCGAAQRPGPHGDAGIFGNRQLGPPNFGKFADFHMLDDKGAHGVLRSIGFPAMARKLDFSMA